MAEVFDLLQIDLVRVAGDRFEGTGSIPIPEDGGDILGIAESSDGRRDLGEVLIGAPPLREPPRQRSDPGRIASATFDFSHPSHFSVNHPVSPVTEGLSQRRQSHLHVSRYLFCSGQ